MYQKRQVASKLLPIPRKGTKYVARALSHNSKSIPVLIALRDMLKMAKTRKEVKYMINNNLLKINGKLVRDARESINLFNILEAGKKYILTIKENGKFALEETSENERIVKIIGKKIISNGKTQINFHDGTNILTDKNPKVGDSAFIDFSGKITKLKSFEKGQDVLVTKGKYLGSSGKIESYEHPNVQIKLNSKDEPVTLNKANVIIK